MVLLLAGPAAADRGIVERLLTNTAFASATRAVLERSGSPAEIDALARAALREKWWKDRIVACAALRELAYGEIDPANQDHARARSLAAEISILDCWIKDLIALDLSVPLGEPEPVARRRAVYRTAIALFYQQEEGYGAWDLRATARRADQAAGVVIGMPARLHPYLQETLGLRARVMAHTETAGTCNALARGLDHWYGDGTLPKDKQLGEFFISWAKRNRIIKSESYRSIDELFFGHHLASAFERNAHDNNNDRSFDFMMSKGTILLAQPYAARHWARIEQANKNHEMAFHYFLIASLGRDVDVSSELQALSKALGKPIPEKHYGHLFSGSSGYYEKSCFGPRGRFHVN